MRSSRQEDQRDQTRCLRTTSCSGSGPWTVPLTPPRLDGPCRSLCSLRPCDIETSFCLFGVHARLLLRDLALLRFPAGFLSSSCLSMNTEESTYGKRSSRGRTAQSSPPGASVQGQRGSRNSQTPTSPFRDVCGTAAASARPSNNTLVLLLKMELMIFGTEFRATFSRLVKIWFKGEYYAPNSRSSLVPSYKFRVKI